MLMSNELFRTMQHFGTRVRMSYKGTVTTNCLSVMYLV